MSSVAVLCRMFQRHAIDAFRSTRSTFWSDVDPSKLTFCVRCPPRTPAPHVQYTGLRPPCNFERCPALRFFARISEPRLRGFQRARHPLEPTRGCSDAPSHRLPLWIPHIHSLETPPLHLCYLGTHGFSRSADIADVHQGWSWATVAFLSSRSTF